MKLESKFGSFAQEGGFTLIEMLIVVAIIGILVAIAVPALNTAKADAQNAKLKAAQSSVALAKNRVFLATNIATDSAVTLAAVQPYLVINGVASPTWAQVMAGTGIDVTGSTDAEVLGALSLTTDYTNL